MKWECKKCGSCCELLPKQVFGIDCKLYDKETKRCKDYEGRPKICRSDTLWISDEHHIKDCKQMQKELGR